MSTGNGLIRRLWSYCNIVGGGPRMSYDFDRLANSEDDLAEIISDRLELSELALRAHRLEDRPGTPIEDRVRIETLLGRRS